MIARASAWKRSRRGWIPSWPTFAIIRARIGSTLLRCIRALRAYGTLSGGMISNRGSPNLARLLESFNREAAMSEDSRLPMRPENLHRGMRLGPIHYVITAEQARAVADTVKAASPEFIPGEDNSKAIVSPTMRLPDYA